MGRASVLLQWCTTPRLAACLSLAGLEPTEISTTRGVGTDARDADALIAYLDLDPRPDESGQHRGRRRLSKRGHPEWRRLLIAAAMPAPRTKVWRDYVTLQRAKALPATAVHVILARKMLRTAFAMFKNGQDFVPPSAQPT